VAQESGEALTGTIYIGGNGLRASSRELLSGHDLICSQLGVCGSALAAGKFDF
jgi:hypothetical protein